MAFKYGTALVPVGINDTLDLRDHASCTKLFKENNVKSSNDFTIELVEGDVVGIRFKCLDDPNTTRYPHTFDTKSDADRYPVYCLSSNMRAISIEGLALYDIELIGAATLNALPEIDYTFPETGSWVQIIVIARG